ncbi:hypothetical protein [Burkholderia stagnalis]|uniref:hypothetical protein n=1 Tax=Burkholderia stagnalis TaxID=1503054 RepID=UPI00163A7A9E|nr:hypothetical protein [Burkholderia stagnalis]
MTINDKGSADVLTERDPRKTNADQGLYRKFDVRRVDGSDQAGGKHRDCEYFVLDVTNDQHARAALRAYATACAPTHPDLSADLVARYALARVEQPAAAPIEEMIRFCPECGRLGDIPAGYDACCPDSSQARVVPKRFAELCAETFRLCVSQPYRTATSATADEWATWDRTRHTLAVAMVGFASRPELIRRNLDAALQVLDALTESGSPLTWLRVSRAAARSSAQSTTET